jgi:hypothetical protein
MSEECVNYYLFSIKFEWFLYNWQPSWHSFKALGVFKKHSEKRLEQKYIFAKFGGFH